jgi:hypothetical protein
VSHKITVEKASNGYIVQSGAHTYVYKYLGEALTHLIQSFDEAQAVRVERVPSMDDEIRRSMNEHIRAKAAFGTG